MSYADKLYEESVRISREVADAIGSNIGYATIMGGLEEYGALVRAEFSRVFPKEECTADAIYLLQSAHWVCTNVDNYEWDDDGNCSTPDPYGEGRVEVNVEYKTHSEDWLVEWRVEGVFFDRAEAQAWGDARHYRWGKHRTYSVPAIGDLAKILASMTTYWDGEPYKKEAEPPASDG